MATHKKDQNSDPTRKYYNINQFRTELWNELKAQAYKLASLKEQNDIADIKFKIHDTLKKLKVTEQYWAYPGTRLLALLHTHLKQEEYKAFRDACGEINRMLASEDYRQLSGLEQLGLLKKKDRKQNIKGRKRYFEVLLVDKLTDLERQELNDRLTEVRENDDQFIYQLVFAKSYEDAMIALQFNSNIQACVIRYGIPLKSKNTAGVINRFISKQMLNHNREDKSELELGITLGKEIKQFRPELDIYYVTDTAVADITDSVLRNFRRIFYRKEDVQELHLSILRGIKERYETPFYTALKEYSSKPTGVFHAMPVSRGNSVFKSNWIDDFGEFYGRNLFLAETSSTTGGLDSLLQPTGPLKKAQELAARAFGSKYTFFATNGTSTSNKIVLQALVEPNDTVLIDRDCHKSHHYGMVLAGANVVYLDSYPLRDYSMYGAVPLKTIKEKLLNLKKADRLDKVKMLILTNCTFDGIVYNVEKVMEEILAIKPDMIFLWDEAWFGFAGFTPSYKQRTGMFVANKLYNKYKSSAYRKTYNDHIASLKNSKDKTPLLPDPDKIKIRVYSTQSTHKTLSSFRQGSMIHIYDEDFERNVTDAFHEAYMTHTSTSANYQILASLDIGRRQVFFEGYELVEKSIEMAMLLRAKINDHPRLNKYFKVLTIRDLIPNEYRPSGYSEYYDPDTGWTRLDDAWTDDDFVLDPTKINLHIGKTGVDGDTFKNKYLMDLFNVQINKTSRNSVLFMTNIGTTRSSIGYLLRVLLKISEHLDLQFKSLNPEEQKLKQADIHSLTKEAPPLPHFSYFHDSFKAVPGIPGGNLREAYFLSYQEKRCEYIKLSDCKEVMSRGREIVSSAFVTPYPPGFPVLVPGQVMTLDILEFLQALDVKEIHGYRPELGLKVFTETALNRQKSATAMGGAAMGARPVTSIKPSKKKTLKAHN